METKERPATDTKVKGLESGEDTSFELSTEEKPATKQEEQVLFASFTLFPKLPLELRLIIWRLALPKRQMFVIINRGCKSCKTPGICPRNGCKRLRSTICSINIKLSTFHFSYSCEARQVALEKQMFVPFTGVLNHPIWTNFSHDGFFFQSEPVFEDFLAKIGEASPEERSVLQQVNRVMVYVDPFSQSLRREILELLSKMTNLRHLGIVFSGKQWYDVNGRWLSDKDSKKQHKAWLRKVWHSQGVAKCPAVTLYRFEKDASGNTVSR